MKSLTKTQKEVLAFLQQGYIIHYDRVMAKASVWNDGVFVERIRLETFLALKRNDLLIEKPLPGYSSITSYVLKEAEKK